MLKRKHDIKITAHFNIKVTTRSGSYWLCCWFHRRDPTYTEVSLFLTLYLLNPYLDVKSSFSSLMQGQIEFVMVLVALPALTRAHLLLCRLMIWRKQPTPNDIYRHQSLRQCSQYQPSLQVSLISLKSLCPSLLACLSGYQSFSPFYTVEL